LNQIFANRTDKAATIVHGSTVATNALLEYKGSRTALVSTAGFKDILQIGRQNRPSLYDLTVSMPKTLVPPELRFEVDERVLHT
jgi:N-methylhydantoinase A